MIVKTIQKNKSDVHFSTFKIKDTSDARIVSGALRHQWNNLFFKGQKRKDGNVICPKILDSVEKNNIKKTIDNMLNDNRYYNYFKSSKKHNNSVPLLPFHTKEITVRNNIVYYKMEINKSKRISQARTLTFKFELERNLADGIYKKAAISLINGTLKLVLDLSSRKETENVNKRNTSVKIAKGLERQIKRVKEDIALSKVSNTLDNSNKPSSKPKKISSFDKRLAKKRRTRLQTAFFEIIWGVYKKASKINFESVKQFNKETKGAFENQGCLPYGVELSDKVIAKLYDDLKFYYKTQADTFADLIRYYLSIETGVNVK